MNSGFYLLPNPEIKVEDRDKHCPVCPNCKEPFYSFSLKDWAYRIRKRVDGYNYNLIVCSNKCEIEFRKKIDKGEVKEYGKQYNNISK